MEDLQDEIERQLGCCMLRLQQYERLLKKMMSVMAIAGPAERLEAARDRRAAGMRGRTLGALVREFLDQHLASASSEAAPTKAEGGHPDLPYASIHITLSMSSEKEVQIRDGLAELVKLRNDLVHHLYEHFDLSSDTGRAAMAHHLESCHARIDGHYRLLHAWATQVARSQALALSVIQSPEFEQAFVHGVLPTAQ